MKNYAGVLKTVRFPYLVIEDLHRGGGDLDFWSVAQNDTFQLSGVGTMNSAQFGNLIAGYAAGVLDDPIAYWLVRGFGALYGVGAALNGYAEWGELAYLGDNADSVSHIDLGAGLGIRTGGNL